MIRIRRHTTRLLAFVAVVAMIVPLVGAVLDHHFAERQPDHLHIGAPHAHNHLHAFDRPHHLHHSRNPRTSVGSTSVDGNTSPVALYKSEISIAVAVAVKNVDAASQHYFHPTSVFILPVPLHNLIRQPELPPPDKPPPHLL